NRPLVTDGRESGGHPARLERRHTRVSLGREGDREARRMLWPAGLRRDRATPCLRPRTARRRRGQPRQPPLRRSRARDPHGQPQGATFKQRNGYGLDELVERSLTRGVVTNVAGGDEQGAMVGNAAAEATGQKQMKRPKNDVSDKDVVVLGSGNLGLVYLMEERRRLTLEEIETRHPQLIPALQSHPHVGWLLVRSSQHGAVALGAGGAHYLSEGRVD